LEQNTVPTTIPNTLDRWLVVSTDGLFGWAGQSTLDASPFHVFVFVTYCQQRIPIDYSYFVDYVESIRT
jgi:hypothetical protein